ncbi:PrgI family protein [Butyrivibrio sp.]|uniref:PrgI family protein n=1 Tax=Butyrivibrio sp. TaxID=28121 RepID=UPI0025C5B237|nr:PrgI family protein [Butyrivibrio sp.]MBQ7430271.1 PrgI family protein [Butyrivibrio sp.]MBQ9303445.1 PrgI family protein [Butyrivibrio sp.]
MAKDIQINGNIQEMKTKVMGPFDGKQLICVLIAAVIEIAGVALVKFIFPGSLVSFLIPVPLALIPLAFGWADEILHMSLQEYYEIVLKHNKVCPKFRPFAIHNYMETQEAKILQAEKAAEQTQSKKVPKSKSSEKKVIPAELQRFE